MWTRLNAQHQTTKMRCCGNSGIITYYVMNLPCSERWQSSYQLVYDAAKSPEVRAAEDEIQISLVYCHIRESNKIPCSHGHRVSDIHTVTINTMKEWRQIVAQPKVVQQSLKVQ